ncbi:hypothetical protein AB0J80_36280 [Actinoplanes sp. NPDC049548]|uniref:hypothetical protein n=1 Tax=Actinoplanes sp. NPDC049548 TaxID=3155152 RepID=UPI003432DD2A
MGFALELLVDDSGRVAVIWLTLIVLAVVALGALALPSGVRRPRQITAWLAQSAAQKQADLRRRAAEAQETIRYAEEIAVAARGAAATAERRREECQQAQAVVEQAWQAWQNTDAALERARRAAAYATPEPVDVDHAERVQALRRAAQAAYRRGDLSDTQLLDALTHRNGWDATLHPVEQELVLARAAAAHRFTAYQKALDAEDAAWKAADVATAAVRTLRTEVMAAQAVADAARQALPEAARALLDRAERDKVVLSAVPEEAPRVAIEAATTQPVLMQSDSTQAVVTQEVRRELPSWAQPTGGRPRIAGAR